MEKKIKEVENSSNFRYLGITFNRNGIDIKAIQDKILGDVEKKFKRLREKSISASGKTLVINSLILPKLYYAALIVPFEKGFIQKVKTLTTDFIWNYKSHLVDYQKLVKKKRYGGMGLIPIEILL
ncbi:hypothetical protein BB558_005156 [Smittium angustum]|uniref:Reverse transcriptase domain-containing protein n=1 Tax=Smittium angustum TaxID=133377 RepID=A0A2U1J188_SMIAN|nr:hypothetical protein BB558_005156 [Smittium angustum]